MTYANNDPRNPCNECGETRGIHKNECPTRGLRQSVETALAPLGFTVSHTDDCSGDHDATSGACIDYDEDENPRVSGLGNDAEPGRGN